MVKLGKAQDLLDVSKKGAKFLDVGLIDIMFES